MYKSIIVQDEREEIDGLAELILKHCPKVKVCGAATTIEDANHLLSENKVEIIFLDISLNNRNGFYFLESIPKGKYSVIFTTSYHEFAIRALISNAIDFILKPVMPDELIIAVEKAIRYYEMRFVNQEIQRIYQESLLNLHESIHSGIQQQRRITIAEQSGFKIINIYEIMYLKADSNYTAFHLSNGNIFVATRNLGEFEKIIDNPAFMRIHKSILINVNYVVGFSSYEGYFAEMKDGKMLSISRRKIDEFRNWIRDHTISID